MRYGRYLICFYVLLIGSSALRNGTAEDAEANNKRFLAIDIQPYANKKLSDDFHTLPGNNLKMLPRERQRMADVDFFIGDKFIQLAGKRAPDHPEKVEGIPINRQITKLHFLHGCGWVGDTGTPIGDYVIHFEDQSTERLVIEYGRDVKDWWLYEFEQGQPTRAVLAWKGLNHASKSFKGQRISIGLFRKTWENPHPENKVVSVDYSSRNETVCSPFLVAITAQSITDVSDLMELIEANKAKSAAGKSKSEKVSMSPEEVAVVEELQEIKALVTFGDDGGVLSVEASGPGLRDDVERGSNETIKLVSVLQSLEKLDVGDSNITDEGLEPLQKLPKLRVLSLNLTQITNVGLDHLKELKSLERLRLHATAISDDGMVSIARLSTLKVLDLSKTKVSDVGMEKLKSLPLLEELDLRSTSVTAAGEASLKESLPKLKIMR